MSISFPFLIFGYVKFKNARKMTNFKKLEVGRTVSKIVFDHNDSEYTYSVERRLRALSILLGAYNLYGRKINIDKYADLRSKFEDLINTIELEME